MDSKYTSCAPHTENRPNEIIRVAELSPADFRCHPQELDQTKLTSDYRTNGHNQGPSTSADTVSSTASGQPTRQKSRGW